jgi:hypothetical protein
MTNQARHHGNVTQADMEAMIKRIFKVAELLIRCVDIPHDSGVENAHENHNPQEIMYPATKD